jgi:phosphoglycolate phosphatase-like HAD superfamily hydrolase
MKKIVIFDIDGTLADCRHRQIHVQGKNKNWKEFFRAADDDEPIEGVVHILKSLWKHRDCRIVLCTGRPESMRPRTLRWFEKYEIFHDELMMRKEGDYRQDAIVKKEMLLELGKENILFAIDDRKQVVEMWRQEGVLCLQCAEGDF